ncbi:MAG: isoprenyl transferase [Desulfatiglandaceae bacterium]
MPRDWASYDAVNLTAFMHMNPEFENKQPVHVAIIMDGNGRWAKQRGMSRIKGHRKGADAVRSVVRACREAGIKWLTLYAFSEENWKRPRKEIHALMGLLGTYLKSELEELQENGIRLRCIGRIDKLPTPARKALVEAMSVTASNTDMQLTLALSYGGRQELVDAFTTIAEDLRRGNLDPENITEELISQHLYAPDMPEPDLLIRTSGEQRISNFLLWQIAYTEFYLTSCLWPDFGKEEFIKALKEFHKRKRRFGGHED